MKQIFISLLLIIGFQSFAFSSQDDRLLAFAKLYSTVKFYYPDPNLSEFSWTALAYKGYEIAYSAKNDEEFIAEIKLLFATIAPGVQITKDNFNLSAITPSEKLNMNKPAFWQHNMALNVGAKNDLKQISKNYIYNKHIGSHSLTQQFSPVGRRMNGEKIKITFWAKLEGNLESIKLVQLMPFTRRTKTYGNFYVSVNSKTWKQYEKIIDYPKEAEVDWINLVFPYSGTAYIDDLKFEKLENKKWVTIPIKNQGFELFEKNGDLVDWTDPFAFGSLAQKDSLNKKEGKYCLKLKAFQDQKLYEPLAFERPFELNLYQNWKAFIPNQLKSNDSVVYPISSKANIKALSDTLSKKIAVNAENNVQAIASAIEIYGYLLHDYQSIDGISEATLDSYFLKGIHGVESDVNGNEFTELYLNFLVWLNDAQIYAMPIRMAFDNAGKVKIPSKNVLANDKLIVEKSLLPNDKLKPGDWIQKINTKNLDSIIKDMKNHNLSEYLQFNAINKYLNAYLTDEATLTISRNGKIIYEKFSAEDNVKLNRKIKDSLEDEEENVIEEKVNMVKSKNTFYFNANQQNVILKNVREIPNNDKRMDSLISIFNQYKTIILDFRDPQQSNFMEYFIEHIQQFDATKSYEQEKISFKPIGIHEYQFIKPSTFVTKSNTYNGKIICLINYNTRGTNEKILFALKQQKLVTFIGSPTAGSGGYANQVQLNNRFRFQYTTNRLVDNSKSPLVQGSSKLSIQPDLLIYPSIESIRDGKDEAVLKALSY